MCRRRGVSLIMKEMGDGFFSEGFHGPLLKGSRTSVVSSGPIRQRRRNILVLVTGKKVRTEEGGSGVLTNHGCETHRIGD